MPVEPISLSIGVVALASLFSTCVECFDLLDAGRGFGRDYELFIIQLQLEKTRLLDWGQSVGLLQTEGVQRPVDLDSPICRPVVEQALNGIRLLWTDSDQLTSRYGLQEIKSDRLDLTTKPRVGLTANAWFKGSWERFQVKINANQRQTPVIKKVRWALHDHAKFKTLVDNLRNLIDALLAVTKTPGTAEQRQQLMSKEIGSIPDTTVLSLLAENSPEIDRDWSEAASEALEASILDEEERVSVCNWLERVGSNSMPTSVIPKEDYQTTIGLAQKANRDHVIAYAKLCWSLGAILEILEIPFTGKGIPAKISEITLADFS